MKKIYKILLITILMALPNCSDVKKGLGFEKDVPDEFLIKKLDPIAKPPNFELMPPNSKKKIDKTKGKTFAKNTTKKIIEGALTDKAIEDLSDTSKPSSLEKDILNVIKKNDNN